MSKLDERGFLLVLAVPVAACAYVLVTLTPYLLTRDTWERDNRGRLMKLAKGLGSEEHAHALTAAEEVLGIIGERKLADPSLLNIQDKARLLVNAREEERREAEESRRNKDALVRRKAEAKAEQEARLAEARKSEEEESRRAAEARRLEELARKKAIETGYLQVVDGWLEDQRKGGYGTSYWENPNTASYLFGVSKWEVLSHRVFESDKHHAVVYVRVWSANKGGQPIVVDWTVDLQLRNGKWVIQFVMQK